MPLRMLRRMSSAWSLARTSCASSSSRLCPASLSRALRNATPSATAANTPSCRMTPRPSGVWRLPREGGGDEDRRRHREAADVHPSQDAARLEHGGSGGWGLFFWHASVAGEERVL